MSVRSAAFPLLLAAATLAGCASAFTNASAHRPDAAAVQDAPDHFLVGSPTSGTTAEPRADEGCRNPMVDPRDNTRLVLVRSSEGQGDYDVPPGRYGVERGHLLRLDCATGRPLGVVPR